MNFRKRTRDLKSIFLLITISLIFYLGQALASPVIDTLKGDLLYVNAFDKQSAMDQWVLEGPAAVKFEDNWMELSSPQEEGHHVYWCPEDFPESFIAEWEFQNMHLDAGLAITFFAAQGLEGESIFDASLKERDGVFSGYTKSDINCYHISYYAHTPKAPDRPSSHLRKNSGFHKVSIGEAPLSPTSVAIHKATLIKERDHIQMYLDDRKIIDWIDNGKTYGPVLGSGKIGFRQMQWTHFRYRNFKVWSIADTEKENAWPVHVIDNTSSGADGVKMTDANGDGKMDLVTGWEEGGITKLYINPGLDKIKYQWPGVTVGSTPSVEDAVFCDLDGDGRSEIVSCTEQGSEKIFVHWPPGTDLLKGSNWVQEVLPVSEDLMMWMYAEPAQIDHLNGVDLVAAGKGADASIGWFESPRKPGKLRKWKWHEISPVGWTMSIIIKDLDHDGDQDIVITDRRGRQRGCRWLENPGAKRSQKERWQSHMIGAEGLEVMFMTMTDLDGDGVEEAIVAERTSQTIRIYGAGENVKDYWEERTIQLTDDKRTAKSVEVGDLNGDGVLDFVVSTNTNGGTTDGLFWLDGSSLERENNFRPISGRHNAKYDRVELLDIDQDGDLDVLICEENYGGESQGLGVVWYENQMDSKY